MITVSQLIEFLSVYNNDAIVRTQDGEQIVNIINTNSGDVILSSVKPIGECNRCHSPVYPTTTEGYVAYCPDHDEDLYSIEFEEIKK
jgi:hypothetical protein